MQGGGAVAVGSAAGQNTQGLRAIAMGENAGSIGQQQLGIAIGTNAGNNNQGANSIAIGRYAAVTNMVNNPVGAVMGSLVSGRVPVIPTNLSLGNVGALSGLTASFIVTPFERIKILFQTNQGNYQFIRQNLNSKFMFQGLSATFYRETPGFAIYFSTYNFLKNLQPLWRVHNNLKSDGIKEYITIPDNLKDKLKDFTEDEVYSEEDIEKIENAEPDKLINNLEEI